LIVADYRDVNFAVAEYERVVGDHRGAGAHRDCEFGRCVHSGANAVLSKDVGDLPLG